MTCAVARPALLPRQRIHCVPGLSSFARQTYNVLKAEVRPTPACLLVSILGGYIRCAHFATHSLRVRENREVGKDFCFTCYNNDTTFILNCTLQYGEFP